MVKNHMAISHLLCVTSCIAQKMVTENKLEKLMFDMEASLSLSLSLAPSASFADSVSRFLPLSVALCLSLSNYQVPPRGPSRQPLGNHLGGHLGDHLGDHPGTISQII